MVFVLPALLLSKVHAYIELVGNPHAVHAHCTFAILQVRQIQVLGQHDMALEKQESQLSYFSCPMRCRWRVLELYSKLHACMPSMGISLGSKLDIKLSSQ